MYMSETFSENCFFFYSLCSSSAGTEIDKKKNKSQKQSAQLRGNYRKARKVLYTALISNNFQGIKLPNYPKIVIQFLYLWGILVCSGHKDQEISSLLKAGILPSRFPAGGQKSKK